MKILKVKIEITHENNATQYVGYPKGWLDNKERIPEILYPRDRTDEVGEDGKLYQIVYPILPDDVYDLLKDLPTCSEPDLTELTSYSEKHHPQTDSIDDEKKVIGILAKVARKEILTPQEEDALNPDKPEKGIRKSAKWTDKLQQYGISNV